MSELPGAKAGAMDSAARAGTMGGVLRAWAAATPDAPAFLFLPDGRSEGPRLTYADLDREARSVAVALRDVAGPGDRALLLYAPGTAFVSAFFGCLYAGVVPVPAYPPRPDRVAQSWQALGQIAADCRPQVVLTDAVVGPFVPRGEAVPALAGARRIVTDGLDPASAGRWRESPTDPDAPALLQYTSGSTAIPRGVVATHRNLMHNQEFIRTAFEHSGPGVGVTWLPPYHDMGLIGGLLQSVYQGAKCVVMSPVVLLRDPFAWLAAVARYRADTSGGPNFAYDLCAQRITAEQKATLDLSHWSVAGIGSEPISARTMDRFAEAFAGCGFRREAFFPAYGLAEATLLVTGGPKGAAPATREVDAAEAEEGRVEPPGVGRPARTLVGCGRTWAGAEVAVVDPEERVRLPAGRVGEVWVRGPSVAQGYWGRPEETEWTFRARLADTGDGPYLRTGDLGFLSGGQLFVTGRIKDLIVIRGRNHSPDEIEATVQAAHSGLRPGCGAAFEAGGDGHPRLVVAQEVGRGARRLDAAQVAGDARQAVAERHGLHLAELVLLKFGTIPKTSSGKVRRHACRAGYEAGTLTQWEGGPT